MEAIAAKRDLKDTTVYSHLAKLAQDGADLNLYNYVSQTEVAQIKTARQELGHPEGLKPYFEHFEEKIEHRTSDINPAETSVIGTYALTINLEDRKIRMEQNVELKSDLNNFYLNFIRLFKLNEKILYEKEWNKTFQRDFQ